MRQVEEVNSTTLDSLLLKNDGFEPERSLLWIDTQGFEGYVLSGAKELLKRNIPICMEFWPYGMARADSYDALKKALFNQNYSLIYDLKYPDKPIPYSVNVFDQIYTDLGEYRNKYTDLLII